MTPSRVVVASQNPDKVREVEALLGLHAPVVQIVRGLTWPEVAETELTLEGNARLKARSVAAYTGIPAISDDTGLEVDALGGDPGVRTARFAGPRATYDQNVALLLERLTDVVDRRAVFRTVAVFTDSTGEENVAEGTLVGRIGTTRRGSGGFGYDSVFEVDGRTLAEIGQADKNLISHRTIAIRSLIIDVWRP